MNIITNLTEKNIIWLTNSHNVVYLIKNFRYVFNQKQDKEKSKFSLSLYLIIDDSQVFIEKINNEQPSTKLKLYIPINRLRQQNIGLIVVDSSQSKQENSFIKFKTEVIIEYDFEENKEKFTPYRYSYDIEKINKLKNIIKEQFSDSHNSNLIEENKKEIINKVSKNFDESSEEEIYNDSKDEVVNIKSLLKEKQSNEKIKLIALKESSNKSESLLTKKRKK